MNTIENLPGVDPLGLKGAALADFGDNPEGFGSGLLPFTASDDGTKLGESTLSCIFGLEITLLVFDFASFIFR